MKRFLFTLLCGALMVVGCKPEPEHDNGTALVNISVKTEDHREFTKGGTFVPEPVIAKFYDGSTRDVTSEAVYSGYDMDGEEGYQTVHVEYTAWNGTSSFDYDIFLRDPALDWNTGYPAGITVEELSWNPEAGKLCHGFKATIDFKANPRLRFNCVMVKGAKKTPSQQLTDFANDGKRGKPALAINAGYFAGTTSVSPVFSQGRVLQYAWRTFNWPNDENYQKPLYAVRACLGQMDDGHFEIQWIYCTNESTQEHTAYPDVATIGNNEQTQTFRATRPTSNPNEFPGCFKWSPREGVGAGPMLVKDGENVAVSSYWYESLDSGGTQGLMYANRTAAGITPDGKLILFTCEGRGVNGSAGLKLAQLADKFIEWGCNSAMNFDGGGSSMMVKAKIGRGNRPTSVAVPLMKSSDVNERPVVSCIIISEETR